MERTLKKGLDPTYVCDNCKYEFKAKDIKLEKKPKNMSMFAQIVVFAGKDGQPHVGAFDNLTEDDRLLGCPSCGKIHFFGFDCKED